MQGAMGGTRPKNAEMDFKSLAIARWLRKHYWRRCGPLQNQKMERDAGCLACGEIGCVEAGPEGGMFAMNHCHACKADYYGGGYRIPKGSPYAKNPSHYYGDRLADGSWVEPDPFPNPLDPENCREAF